MLFCGVPLYVQADLVVFFYFGKETTRSRSEYSFEAVAAAGYSPMGLHEVGVVGVSKRALKWDVIGTI